MRDYCTSADGVRKKKCINRNDFAIEYDEIRDAMGSGKFFEKMAQRQSKIEGLFAEAKQNNSLHGVNFRGKSKVQMQEYMIAIVQVLKRVMK